MAISIAKSTGPGSLLLSILMQDLARSWAALSSSGLIISKFSVAVTGLLLNEMFKILVLSRSSSFCPIVSKPGKFFVEGEGACKESKGEFNAVLPENER